MRICKPLSFKEVLTRLENEMGFVLQGVAGDPDEVMVMINRSLRAYDVFLDEHDITEGYFFTHEGRQCFAFTFRGTLYDIPHFETWRKMSYECFEGLWLDDFIAMNRI